MSIFFHFQQKIYPISLQFCRKKGLSDEKTFESWGKICFTGRLTNNFHVEGVISKIFCKWLLVTESLNLHNCGIFFTVGC